MDIPITKTKSYINDPRINVVITGFLKITLELGIGLYITIHLGWSSKTVLGLENWTGIVEKWISKDILRIYVSKRILVKNFVI